MSWEDGLNETVGLGMVGALNTGVATHAIGAEIVTGHGGLGEHTAHPNLNGGDPLGRYNERRYEQEAALRDYNTQTQAATGPYGGATPQAPPGYRPGTNAIHRCYPTAHYFECKHERRCECGLTERLPLELPEGL